MTQIAGQEALLEYSRHNADINRHMNDRVRAVVEPYSTESTTGFGDTPLLVLGVNKAPGNIDRTYFSAGRVTLMHSAQYADVSKSAKPKGGISSHVALLEIGSYSDLSLIDEIQKPTDERPRDFWHRMMEAQVDSTVRRHTYAVAEGKKDMNSDQIMLEAREIITKGTYAFFQDRRLRKYGTEVAKNLDDFHRSLVRFEAVPKPAPLETTAQAA